MKKNNKGYSLVELLITMAIFAIIMLAIILMMRTSLVSYKDGLFETTMQEEAQIAANQVSDLLIDATYIRSFNGALGAETYTFDGPEGTFTIKHVGNNLIYDNGSGEQLLSNQMKTFYISGLSKRASGDTAEIYDNAATVNVGIEYQDRVYSASKDTYFRNNIENKASDSEEYDPFDVGTAPITTPSPSPSNVDTAEVLRFKPFDISAVFDIVADAQLSTSAQGYFKLIEENNTTIKNPISGMTVKHYKVDVLDAYKSTTGFGLSSPAGSDQVTVTGKDSNGAQKTVQLHLSAVTFDAGSGIFEDYKEADVNENGYPTNVKVKGIHINEAIKSGLEIKYSMDLKKGSTSVGSFTDQTLSYNSDATADKANSVPQLGSFDLKLGLVPDPVSGGFVITSSNGYRVSQKGHSKGSLNNADGNQTLTIKFKINNTNMNGLTLNYKYYVTGNSLENAN